MTIKEILELAIEKGGEFWLKGNKKCFIKIISFSAKKIKLKIIKPSQEVIFANCNDNLYSDGFICFVCCVFVRSFGRL